jgi:hypothetical protein
MENVFDANEGRRLFSRKPLAASVSLHKTRFNLKPRKIDMQTDELSYAINTPYAMRKSRTGGIVGR